MEQKIAEASLFSIQRIKSNTNEKEVEGVLITFASGDSRQAKVIGRVVLRPQTLRGMMALFSKFAKENKSFFDGTEPIGDGGKI